MTRGDRPDASSITRVDHETEVPSSTSDWLPQGRTIDRYQIHECLGVGGMGVIYSAWDPELERKLALKLVRVRTSERNSTRARARLLREARALARLRHPNVVAVHDVGEHAGRVFVAMEFIAGETLQRWLLRSPPPPGKQLVDVFLQVGRGLAAAHRAGIVHRDVKPDNVMIGSDGRVLILDFGIARESFEHPSSHADDPPDEPEPTDSSTPFEPEPQTGSQLAPLTRAGAVLGTPAYMSPEQHRGQPVDARSDQFSFCVAMWEALNGEKPYGEGSRQKLLARMRHAELRRFRNRDLPRRIAKTLARGLAYDPEDRFARMEELLEQLNPRGNSNERLWQGLAIGALGGMVLGTLIGLGGAKARRTDPQPPPSCAELGQTIAQTWSPAHAERLRARSLAGAPELETLLDGWARRWAEAREQSCREHFELRHSSAALHDTQLACLERGRAAFAEFVGQLEHGPQGLPQGAQQRALSLPPPETCLRQSPDATPRSAAQLELDEALRRLELRAELGVGLDEHEALDELRRIKIAARELDDSALGAGAAQLEARLLEQHGQLEQACERLLEAARLAAVGDDDHTQVEVLLRAAALLAMRGRDEEARHWLALAEALLAGLDERDALGLRARTTQTRAALELELGRPHLARQLLLDGRAAAEQADDPLALALTLHQLARVELELELGERALELLREASSVRSRELGSEHPSLAELWTDMARAQLLLGDEAAALAELQRTLELGDLGHARRARAHSLLGQLHARAKRCEASARAHTEAIQSARAHAEHSLLLAQTLEHQAIACGSSLPEALDAAREAVALREELQGARHPALAHALLVEVLALLAQRVDPPALEAIEVELARAAHSLEGHEGPEHHLLAFARGLTLLARGLEAQARPQLEAAATGLGPHSEHRARIEAALATLPAP